MLHLLNKQNNNEYITRSEIKELLKHILNQKYIKGAPGNDAKITKDVIDRIVKIVKPIKGIDYRDGEDGKDYVLSQSDIQKITEDITSKVARKELSELVKPSQLANMLRSVKGNDRLVVDNIKGFKRYIQRINELSDGYSNLVSSIQEDNEELLFIKKKLDLITIDIAQGGGADGVLTKAEIDCTSNELTLTTEKKGVETPIVVDLSCLIPTNVCESFEPTTEGEAEGFIDGSHWYYENGDDKALFTLMCGQWIKTCVCDCDYVTEEGDAEVVTEEGDCVIWEED